MASLKSITVPPQRFRKTLVYYYMPHCPYCKEFAPVFLELTKLCKNMTFCSLAAVDITQHQDVGVPIKTVPTIIYFDGQGVPHKMPASSAEDRSLLSVATFYKQQHDMDKLNETRRRL